MTRFPPWYIDRCRASGIQEEDIQKLIHSGFWNAFFEQVIMKDGIHGFLMGRTSSGKSQKLRHFLKFIAPKETIIYFDTGKPGDLELMLTLGKPVQILIPYGCSLDLRGKVPCKVEVTPVFDPGMYWREIKKDWINIISLSNYFLDEDNHRRYVRQMFNNYLLNAKLGKHDHFVPCTIAADEAQSILGSGRVKASPEAKATAQAAANIFRQIRACGERWIIISQSYYDIVGGARENAPWYVVCGGTRVEGADDPTLKYLAGFARTCEPWAGWVVLPNGRYYGSDAPLKFPLYEVPPVKVLYRGFVDENVDVIESPAIFDEVDPGVFAAMMQQPDAEPVIPSRYEVSMEDEG